MKKIVLALSVLFLVQGCEDQNTTEIGKYDYISGKPDLVYLPPNEKLFLMSYGATWETSTTLSSFFITRKMRPTEEPETYNAYSRNGKVAVIFEQKKESK